MSCCECRVAASPVLPLASSYSFLFALTSSSGLYKRGKSILLLRAPGPAQHSPVPSKLSAAPPEDPTPTWGWLVWDPLPGGKGVPGMDRAWQGALPWGDEAGGGGGKGRRPKPV